MDNIIKILFIANSASLGGASLSLLSLLKRLPLKRFEPLVVLPEEGPMQAELDILGVKVIQCYQPWWVTPGTVDAWLYSMRRLPKTVEKLRKLIRNKKIDLVYTNSSVIPAGAIAATLEGKAHIWRVREFVEKGLFSDIVDPDTIKGCILALSSCVVPISNALSTEFRSNFNNCKIRTIHVGIDCNRFATVVPVSKNSVILSIGTNSENKGLSDLVEAAGLLEKRGVDFSVKLLGSFYYPEYIANIRRRLDELSIFEKFEFIDYKRDIRPWLAQAAVYCCPSRSEGMSRTIVEAMAAGLPVVSTDCGGPRDLVKEGVTGTLVPVGNIGLMADALEEMLSEHKIASEMGDAGRKIAQSNFDVNQTIPKLIDILEETVNEKKHVQETLPLCEMFMTTLSLFGQRVLLGKKWRLLKHFI